MSDSSKQDVFIEVRKRGSSNSKIEKENFDTLKAIEESIQSKSKGELTPVKYFNALMTMLNTNTAYYRSLLYLLQLILPQVPDSAKQNKCSDCMEVLLQIPKSHKKTFEPSANRSLIVCICLILKSQKPSDDMWKEKSVKKSFTYLLNQCIHKSPKIRHVAEDEIASIMQVQSENHLVESSKEIISFLKTLNKKMDTDSSKDIVNFLSLIAKVILFIDQSQYDSLLSLLLQIRSHQINYLEYKSLHPLEIILSSTSPITPSHVKDLLTAMLSSPVAETATSVDILEYIKTMCVAANRMLTETDGNELFIKTLTTVLQYYSSSNNELLSLLTPFLSSFYSSIKVTSLQDTVVEAITTVITGLMKKIAKDVYVSFIPSVASFIQLIGGSFPQSSKTLIQSLLDLYDSCSGKNTIHRPVIVDGLKAAVLAVPLDCFLKAVSLSKENNLPNENHYFLFLLLADSLRHKPCSLALFFDYFTPMIKACQKEIASVKNITQKRRYQINLADIFSIFASCCVCATDAATVLPNYKKMLVRVIDNDQTIDAGVAICKAMAILIRSNQQQVEKKEASLSKDTEKEEFIQEDEKDDEKDDDEVDEIPAPFMEKLTTSQAPKIDASQAKKNLEVFTGCMEVFIEAGLSLYERCHGNYEKEIPKFNGVGQGGEIAVVLSLRYALTVMCSITPSTKITSLVERVINQIQSVNGSTETSSLRQHIVCSGELAVLIPSAQSDTVMNVLSFVKGHLEEASYPVLQRRYYYCFLLLCHYHGDALAEQNELKNTVDLLLSNLLTQSVLVRKFRIKSLFYLLNHFSGDSNDHIMYLVSTIPQFVLCIKDSNKTIRSICFDIVISLSVFMKNASAMITLPDGSENPASLVEFFKIMMGGLSSDTAHMKSASLMCISCVLYYHRDDNSIWPTLVDLIHIVYSFLEEKSRELVKACFGFIRTCVKAMPEDLLKEELHDILVALLPWAKDSRNHFKSRVRAIVELLVRRLGKTTIQDQLGDEEKGLVDQILNTEPVKTDEQLVKEMEDEIEKFEPNEEDEQEVIEIDEAGNVVGEDSGKMDDDFASLLQEIANSEDLKRAVRRREMWENEEQNPSKRQKVEEEVKEMEVEEKEEKPQKKSGEKKKKSVSKKQKVEEEVKEMEVEEKEEKEEKPQKKSGEKKKSASKKQKVEEVNEMEVEEKEEKEEKPQKKSGEKKKKSVSKKQSKS